jgi:hypothetical protein|tara:strand:+ start:84 stop:728 length:645 start_codon:yes stop_codon:yes gene_type:complete
MCAIFGSKDKDKFLELAELNQYRGNFAHSTTVFQTGLFQHYPDAERVVHVTTNTGEGEFKDSITMSEEEYKTTYYLGHVQAPTTDSVETHPSNINGDLLWHNGIIKDYQVQEWKQELGNRDWDTELLHRHLVLGGDLDNVDGTFSCARYTKDNIFLFRNEISPLFYDDDMNISSTKFDNSLETEAGVMYLMDLVKNNLEPQCRFETKENPYYFG